MNPPRKNITLTRMQLLHVQSEQECVAVLLLTASDLTTAQPFNKPIHFSHKFNINSNITSI